MGRLPPLPRIIIDSNEVQHGHQWTFAGLPTKVANLYTGDYSLEGYETRVTVERKTHGDWFGCLGDGRRRFRDCLERLAAFDSAVVIIEADLESLAVPPSRSSLRAAHSLSAYISWQEEFGVPIQPWPNREWAERAALLWLTSFWRHLHAHGLTSLSTSASPSTTAPSETPSRG